MASRRKASSSAIRIFLPPWLLPTCCRKGGRAIPPPAYRPSWLRVYHLENISPELDRLLPELIDQFENLLPKSTEGGRKTFRPSSPLPPPHAAHLAHPGPYARPIAEGTHLSLLLRGQNLANFEPQAGGFFLKFGLKA